MTSRAPFQPHPFCDSLSIAYYVLATLCQVKEQSGTCWQLCTELVCANMVLLPIPSNPLPGARDWKERTGVGE